jgi:hypothetical protein
LRVEEGLSGVAFSDSGMLVHMDLMELDPEEDVSDLVVLA